ncbi:MAG TPA: VOC family protein [Bacteroidota bacterium]|nr:VOC family protein [Bacteroidota bacterium]
MLKGLRTALYHVSDLAAAKLWYSGVLGKEPYFDEPFYVGFNVGGFELGLDPDLTGVSPGNSHAAYWGVDDIERCHARLIALGATERSGIQDVGGGIKVASVIDPFGNPLGIIENPVFRIEES